MEGSCPVVVRHVDEPEANRPHTRVCEGLLSWFSLDIFDMTEEDRLLDFMKGLQPTYLRQNVQDLGAEQAASLLDGKYLARGSRDQAKGKGLKYRKGKHSKRKPSLRPRKASSRSGTKADREERRKASSAPSP